MSDGPLSLEHTVQQVHDGEIGEVLSGNLGQLVRGTFQVECGADACAGIVQDAQPLTGPGDKIVSSEQYRIERRIFHRE